MPNKSKEVDNVRAYNNDSRYFKLPIYYDKTLETYFNPLPVPTEITGDEDDFYYIVEIPTEDRLDLIAHMFYTNSRLWWAIAERNKISDPFKVPVGTSLIIPSTSNVYRTFLTR